MSFSDPQSRCGPVQDADSLSTMSSERLPVEWPFQNWEFSHHAVSERVKQIPLNRK